MTYSQWMPSHKRNYQTVNAAVMNDGVSNLDHTVMNDNYHVKKTWVMSKVYTNIYPCDCICL